MFMSEEAPGVPKNANKINRSARVLGAPRPGTAAACASGDDGSCRLALGDSLMGRSLLSLGACAQHAEVPPVVRLWREREGGVHVWVFYC
jgi:hypothetical protein